MKRKTRAKRVILLCLLLANKGGYAYVSDHRCLASAIYHEARGEGIYGMSLVGNVILNRAKHNKKGVCSVVFEKGQFSWVRHKSVRADAEADSVAKSLLESEKAGNRIDYTHGATYFARVSVKKRWMRKLSISLRHKGHVFYRKGRYENI